MDYLLATSQGLARQLDGCMAHDAEYNHGLKRSLAHAAALHSMHALGATESRQRRNTRLTHPARNPDASFRWTQVTGWHFAVDLMPCHTLSGDVRVGESQSPGATAYWGTLLHLMPGVGAGALHGLIRCGHAQLRRGTTANWAGLLGRNLVAADAQRWRRRGTAAFASAFTDLASWARVCP